jgi:hypothetical protein
MHTLALPTPQPLTYASLHAFILDLSALAARAQCLGVTISPSVHDVPRALFDLIDTPATYYPATLTTSAFWTKHAHGVTLFCHEPTTPTAPALALELSRAA